MVFWPNLGVNRRDRLCGIPEYASAQSLDFLDLGQKSSFLNWKRRNAPIFKKTINGWALDSFQVFQVKDVPSFESLSQQVKLHLERFAICVSGVRDR